MDGGLQVYAGDGTNGKIQGDQLQPAGPATSSAVAPSQATQAYMANEAAGQPTDNNTASSSGVSTPIVILITVVAFCLAIVLGYYIGKLRADAKNRL